jgi:hypothetical protein
VRALLCGHTSVPLWVTSCPTDPNGTSRLMNLVRDSTVALIHDTGCRARTERERHPSSFIAGVPGRLTAPGTRRRRGSGALAQSVRAADS